MTSTSPEMGAGMPLAREEHRFIKPLGFALFRALGLVIGTVGGALIGSFVGLLDMPHGASKGVTTASLMCVLLGAALGLGCKRGRLVRTRLRREPGPGAAWRYRRRSEAEELLQVHALAGVLFGIVSLALAWCVAGPLDELQGCLDFAIPAALVFFLARWPLPTLGLCFAGLLAYDLATPPWPSYRRMGSNEACGMGCLRTLADAQEDYRKASAVQGYAPTLSLLGTGEGGGGVRLIDEGLASGQRSGYRFQMRAYGFACPRARVIEAGEACGRRSVDCRPGPDGRCLVHGEMGSFACWSAESHPLEYGRTGMRSFFIDQKGVLRAGDLAGAPGTSSLPEW